MIAKRSLFALAKGLEGVPILGALGGTSAARAGLRYGDVLLEVNGRRTRSIEEYIEAKDLRQGGMSVVVFRAGEQIALEFTYSGSPAEPSMFVSELVSMRVGAQDEGPDPTGTA